MARKTGKIRRTDDKGPLRPLMPGYLPHSLGRLMNLLNYRLMDYLRPYDMTPQQFRVIQVLNTKGVASVGELSRDVVVEQSVISRIVDQLEEKGFAFRRRRPGNARIVEVRPTPEGEAAIRALQPQALAIVADTLSVLSRKETVQLRDMMERMFDRLSGGPLELASTKQVYGKARRI